MKEEDVKLIENLNKLFKSKKFMHSIMQDLSEFSVDIFYRMGIVLSYYIATRDEEIDYEYEEIEGKFQQLEFSDEKRKNIIDNGFITHSFNGYKKERIAQYGLDYMSQLNETEKEEIYNNRNLLNELEYLLGESGYDKEENNQEDEQRVYLCSPGAKTFYYACSESPERLYEGPLKGQCFEPIIVGEKKSTYLMRVLEKKIRREYKEEESEKINHAVEVAKKVIDIFCTQMPAFALIKISDIKGIEVESKFCYRKTLDEIIERVDLKDFFSKDPSGFADIDVLGDLAILSKFIPKNSIYLVECMDDFELKQTFARMKGLRTGDYIDFTQDKEHAQPTVEQLTQVINDCQTIQELYELNEKYISIKTKTAQIVDETTLSGEDEIPLNEDTSKFSEFEQKMQEAQESYKSKSNIFLQGIIAKERFSDISMVGSQIRSLYLQRTNPEEDLCDRGENKE